MAGPVGVGLWRASRVWVVCASAWIIGGQFAIAHAQPRLEGLPIACVSSAETRKLFVANKLIQPFRVMREAAFSARAEAIDIQLCRYQGALVYDVTLLNEVGEILHRLFDANNGAPIAGYPFAGQAPAAHPADREPDRIRPPLDIEPPARMGPFGGPIMRSQPGLPAGGPGGGGVSGPGGKE